MGHRARFSDSVEKVSSVKCFKSDKELAVKATYNSRRSGSSHPPLLRPPKARARQVE
jgi:hypothetical protein